MLRAGKIDDFQKLMAGLSGGINMNYVLAMFHLFFITLFTTRMEETNLFVEVNTSTFQIWDERPLCRIVPTALTVQCAALTRRFRDMNSEG